MKTIKQTLSRMLALALAFLLTLTVPVPALAANADANTENLKITIHNNKGLPKMDSNQFKVYQLFTGTPAKDPGISTEGAKWDASNWNNWTLADIQWGQSISEGQQSALLTALQKLDPAEQLWLGDTNPFAEPTPLKTAADVAAVLAGGDGTHPRDNAFMQGFASWLLDESGIALTAIAAPCETYNDDADAANDTLTYTVPGTGYYLFAETASEHTGKYDAVSEYIFAVMGDQDIDLKASVPDVAKDIVKDETTDVKGDAAGVGELVQFKLTGTLPENFGDFATYKYIFHDTLSAGLKYVSDTDTVHPLTVTVYPSQADAEKKQNGVEVAQTVTVDGKKGYTVTTSGTADQCSLEVVFEDLKALQQKAEETGVGVSAESYVVVTYWAEVTDQAIVGLPGNPNTVELEFSNDPNHEGTGKTEKKNVYVYAFGLDLTKVGSDSEHAKAGLEGAGFVLKDADGNYAIFKNQWKLEVTKSADVGETKQITFYDSEESAKAAQTEALGEEGAKAEVTGPVRRLTGWTGTTGTTTASVGTAIDNYKDKKKAFDKASSDDQKDPASQVSKDLAEAKAALSGYLLESGKNGEIPDVYGLDDGKYSLQEVITPAGYNTMAEFGITISAEFDETTGKLTQVTYTHDGKSVTYKETYGLGEALPDGETQEDMIAHFKAGLIKDTLVNQKAPLLPFTGGRGTMIFYILGAALILGAVVYLVFSSRRAKKI